MRLFAATKGVGLLLITIWQELYNLTNTNNLLPFAAAATTALIFVFTTTAI